MQKTKGILFAIIAAATFGLIAFFSIPLLKSGMNVQSILFYRSLFATIILGLIILLRGKSITISPQMAMLLFAMGILYTITAMGFVYSFQYISSGISTTLHFIYPIAVASIMMIFYKEKKSITIFIAALLSLMGVAMLCWSDNGIISSNGLLAVLITVFTYSVYIVTLNKPSLKRIESEVITFYIMLFGTCIFSVFTSLTTGIQTIPNITSFANLLGFVVVCTIASNLALIKAVAYAGSTTTSLLGSVEPVVATAVGIFHFNESYGLNTLAGLILIISSVVLIIKMNSKQAKKEEKTHIEQVV